MIRSGLKKSSEGKLDVSGSRNKTMFFFLGQFCRIWSIWFLKTLSDVVILLEENWTMIRKLIPVVLPVKKNPKAREVLPSPLTLR